MGRTQSWENKLIAGEMQMPQCMCGTITLDRIKERIIGTIVGHVNVRVRFVDMFGVRVTVTQNPNPVLYHKPNFKIPLR